MIDFEPLAVGVDVVDLNDTAECLDFGPECCLKPVLMGSVYLGRVGGGGGRRNVDSGVLVR